MPEIRAGDSTGPPLICVFGVSGSVGGTGGGSGLITSISEVSGSTGVVLGDSGSTTSTGRGVGGIIATNAGDVACFGEMRFKISAGMRLLKYKYPPEPASTRIRNKKIFYVMRLSPLVDNTITCFGTHPISPKIVC